MGSSSGLIIAFVVAVWAAYFVPLALRRYDESGRAATVDRAGDSGRVITPSQAASTSTSAESSPVPPAAAKEPVMLDRPAARLAAKRRRRTLLSLIALLALVTVVAVAGVVPVWSIAAPVALIAGWLVACRVQVRGELGLTEPREKVAKPPKAEKVRRPIRVPREKATPAPRSVDDEPTVVVSGQLEDVDPGRQHEMEMTPVAEDALDDQVVIAVPSVSTSGQALWDPLPITVPTYVTKPRVGRTVRTVDFAQSSTWTSGHVEAADEQPLPGLEAEKAEAPREDRAVGE